MLVEPPAVVLGRLVWKGNPPTKKNRPMVLSLCRDAEGKNRKLGTFLEELKTAAEMERDRFFRFLDLLNAAAAEQQHGQIIHDIEEVLGHRADRTRLLQHLDSALDDGGLSTIVLPSDDYREAQRLVVPSLRAAWQSAGKRILGGPDEPLHVVAHFFLGPRQRPDFLSLQEACSDLLQEAGVITNDSWIDCWDGSRRIKNQRNNPRTEVTIYPFEEGGAQQCLLPV